MKLSLTKNQPKSFAETVQNQIASCLFQIYPALAVDLNCFRFRGKKNAFNYLFVCIPKIKTPSFSLQATID